MGRSRRSSAGRCSSADLGSSSPPTAIAPPGPRISTRPTRSRRNDSVPSGRYLSSTVPRWVCTLRSHGLHLAQRRQAPERFQFDLSYALARETEPAADLLERLRLRVVEAVTQNEHLTLALL